jgi:chitin disaccharide deacetylase
VSARVERPSVERSLVEQLGYPSDTKLLIVNCDDLGSTRAANVGVHDALRNGLGTSASVMVPCPWARDAAVLCGDDDVGVHLTLNAEWETYRWGPITYCPSLLDGDGGFPRTLEDTWDHADLDEVARELRAQIERALLWGFDVTHLDSHMGALQLRADFFDVYLQLGVEFDLPLRMGPAGGERVAGFPYRELATAEGIVFPDHLVYYSGVGARRHIEAECADLEPGVTELYLHPAHDSDELRSSHPDWAERVDDHAFLCIDPALPDLVEQSGALMIGYRELRELQRSRTSERLSTR